MRLNQAQTGHPEPKNGIERVKSEQLIGRPKKSKVSGSSSLTIAVSIKTLDAEQTASAREKALRLFCRAMIRLYLQDNGNPENGKRLGVL
jgi:hypothetical protein